MVLGRHEIGTAQCSDRAPVNGPTGEVLAVGVVAVLPGTDSASSRSFDECFELDQPRGPGAGLTDVRERVLVPVPALLGGLKEMRALMVSCQDRLLPAKPEAGTISSSISSASYPLPLLQAGEGPLSPPD